MTDCPIVGIDASRSYREPMTGTERYSRRIIEQMMALDSGGMRYRLYFNQPPPPRARTGQSEIRTIPARRFWTHYRLSRELRADPVDMLLVPSHVLPLYRPERSVVTIHDLGYLHEPDSHTPSSRIQLRLTTQWNADRATHLIAISESTRQDLIENCKVDPARISVIRHGVDERFTRSPEDAVERYRRAAHLPDNFVLHLGTIHPRKNLTRLIEAFEFVAHQNPNVHLILAGNPGWMSEPIRERAKVSPFQHRIRFLGRVPDEQLPLLYSAATVLAMPSLYEGFGMPVLEAMACGTPVVMSTRGALPELAGADAQLVEPTNTEAISQAISGSMSVSRDPDAREDRMAHAASYSWESAARESRDVLWTVLNQ